MDRRILIPVAIILAGVGGVLAMGTTGDRTDTAGVWRTTCTAGGSETTVRFAPGAPADIDPVVTVYGPSGDRIGPVRQLSRIDDGPGALYRGDLPETYRENVTYTIAVSAAGTARNVSCSPVGDCPDGMVPVYSRGGFCIFRYEAARRDATATDTGTSPVPVSSQGVVPWNAVNRSTAAAACRRAGYRLPTNAEWQAATLALPGRPATQVSGNNDGGVAVENRSQTCVLDRTRDAGWCLTGTGPDAWCTPAGVCDLNGNLKEWTRTSHPGSGCASALQGELRDGYVAGWNDTAACPSRLAADPVDAFGGDHFWAPDGPGDGAIRRGGSYIKGRRAGPFNIGLNYPPTADGDYLGFRCVMDG